MALSEAALLGMGTPRDYTPDESELHRKADALAADIERAIQKGQERLAEVPDFELGRRARNSVIDVDELLES